MLTTRREKIDLSDRLRTAFRRGRAENRRRRWRSARSCISVEARVASTAGDALRRVAVVSRMVDADVRDLQLVGFRQIRAAELAFLGARSVFHMVETVVSLFVGRAVRFVQVRRRWRSGTGLQ